MDIQKENEPNKSIDMMLNDELLDELDFRPITEGLGFQKDKSKKVVQVRTAVTKSNVVGNLQENSTSSKVDMGDLAPFYERSLEKPQVQINVGGKLTEQKSPESDDTVSAKGHEIFAAWIIDVIICCLLVALTIFFLIAVSGINYKLILKILSVQTSAVYGVWLFSSFYVCYFSLLDTMCDQTIGKSILGLKLKSNKNITPSFKQAIIRSVVSLISLLALGLPNILNFHGLLSNTKIIKK